MILFRTQKIGISAAKIQIKSERITPFGGIFPIMDFFNRLLSQTIDKTLGLRSKFFGYQYSEIIRSLMCIYFCGGTCIEDVSKHLMSYLSQHPKLRTCSSDTILRAIEYAHITKDSADSRVIEIDHGLSMLGLNAFEFSGKSRIDSNEASISKISPKPTIMASSSFKGLSLPKNCQSPSSS